MLFKLLGLPFTLPAAGLKFCFEKVADMAEAELYDDEAVKEQLLLLQMQLEEGEIEDEDYAEQEAVLFARLREIKAHREALAREHAEEMRAEAQAQVSGKRRVIVETPFDDQP